jgi:hypothetical protein
MAEIVRLTNFVREQTLKALLAKRFAKEEAALKAEEASFAMKLYKAVYPEYKQAQKLCEGWISQQSSFRVRDRGQVHRYELSQPMPMPYNQRDRNMAEELATEGRTLRQKRELYEAQRESARDHAKALLWSVSTLKRLLEVWPEAKPFLPKDLEQPPTALTIPMAQLNAVFGLGAK